MRSHNNTVSAVAFSPDGKSVVSGSWDCTVRLWDAVTGAVLRILTGHPYEISAVIFSADGNSIGSVSWHQVIAWDSVTGTTLAKHGGIFSEANFFPTGIFIQGKLVTKSWIQQDGKNIIWLPPLYRTTHRWLKGGIVVLAKASGHIFILK